MKSAFFRDLRSLYTHRPIGSGAAGIALLALVIAGCTATFPGTTDDAAQSAYEPPAVEEEEGPGWEDDPREVFADLDYYGGWYWIDPYGWTWRPTVVMEWRPFVNGQWIWSRWGWTWLSYEPFGWATEHYGWWAYDFALGWIWIPGYEWSPAPVRWIGWGDTVGWAPLPWGSNRWEEPWETGRVEPWVIVSTRHFADPKVGRRSRPPRFAPGRVTVNRRPPEASALERAGSRSFRVAEVRVEQTPVGGKMLRRIALPPEAAERVQKLERERTRAFRVEYRRRNGADPPRRESKRRWKKARDQPDKPAPRGKRGEKIKGKPQGKRGGKNKADARSERDKKTEEKPRRHPPTFRIGA